MILAGDIGGTHTRLALFEKGVMVSKEGKYPSQKYPNLEAIIQEFLQGKKVEKACFGVAGPIQEGKSKITNLSWVIDGENIRKKTGIPFVHIMNDLQANAFGIRTLKKEELFLVHPGRFQVGNQALISAGTGLGEAGLIWDGQWHRPFASEGGHTDFAPRDELEMELLNYLKAKFGHVSYERVVSGPGLKNIFDFLIATKKETLRPEVAKQMEEANPSRVISEWGSQEKDRACQRALELFFSLYGAEAGNLALKFLAVGGVYLGGGIAPAFAQKIKEGSFHAAFVDKGRFRGLLESIPIWIIMNDNAALLGAANYLDGE